MSNTKMFMGENVEIYSCMMVREFLKSKGLKRALAVFDAETKRVRGFFFRLRSRISPFFLSTNIPNFPTHRFYLNVQMKRLQHLHGTIFPTE